MQRQRLITTIENVIEKKNSSKAKLDIIVSIKLTTTTGQGGGQGGGRVEGKKKKKIQNKSKHNNKCFTSVTAVRVLSLAGSHSPPHLPRVPSNTVLISGPAVGAAQIIIWSYSCLF